jgi:IS30 family transposase
VNKVKGTYDPSKAHHKAYVRRKYSKYQGMKIVENPDLRKFVEKALKDGRSPESIAGRINNHEKGLSNISGDSIERFLKSVYGRKIEAYRRKQKSRQRHKRRIKTTQLKDRNFIDKRPKIANKRGRVGDAESDFIISGKNGKGYILTVADRKLRVSFLEKILPVSIENVKRGFFKIKERYPELRTITTDNDILLVNHKELERLLGIKIYFCHPYHSWEKGTIENTNGEIRKYIPKGSDISQYSPRFIRHIENKINDRYMECIKFLTPDEALELYRKQKRRRGARKS